jgi:thioredoxin 1
MAEHVNDQNFATEVLQSNIPVLVDFYAEWCGPCKMMAPVIDELATEYAGKVKIVKVDVDANQQTAGQFQVMSIPTLFVFKNGDVVDQMIGFQDKGVLKGKLDTL